MSNFLPIFRSLQAHKVRYVAVGGIAVNLHGYARFTADADLIVDFDRPNIKTLNIALEELGYKPRLPVDAGDLANEVIRKQWIEEKGMLVFSWYSEKNPLVIVDIFVTNPIPFDELFTRSRVLEVEEVSIRFAAIDDIIELKKGTGRHKDEDDIEALLAIKRPGK